jgi:hypothetical protein
MLNIIVSNVIILNVAIRSVFILSAATLSVTFLSAVKLSVNFMSVVKLSDIILSVPMLGSYAEPRHSEPTILINTILSLVLPSALILSVSMQSVM